jgi:hypothetical protein
MPYFGTGLHGELRIERIKKNGQDAIEIWE